MMAPFARPPLLEVEAFVPTYEAALLINDLITAVLLFGQFTRVGTLPFLILASGYLFDAFIIIPHALSFRAFFHLKDCSAHRPKRSPGCIASGMAALRCLYLPTHCWLTSGEQGR
jgi:hypothetical protein